MAQSMPVQTRSRAKTTPMTAEEAQARADQLMASAELLPVGNARTRVLKEACDYRMLAEMKRMIAAPKAIDRAS